MDKAHVLGDIHMYMNDLVHFFILIANLQKRCCRNISEHSENN